MFRNKKINEVNARINSLTIRIGKSQRIKNCKIEWQSGTVQSSEHFAES